MNWSHVDVFRRPSTLQLCMQLLPLAGKRFSLDKRQIITVITRNCQEGVKIPLGSPCSTTVLLRGEKYLQWYHFCNEYYNSAIRMVLDPSISSWQTAALLWALTGWWVWEPTTGEQWGGNGTICEIPPGSYRTQRENRGRKGATHRINIPSHCSYSH